MHTPSRRAALFLFMVGLFFAGVSLCAEMPAVAPQTSSAPGGGALQGRPDGWASKHPAVVHFPIALLTLAPFFAFAALRAKTRTLPAVSAVLLTAGFAGAIAASFVFHAEPAGLSPAVRDLLEEHEHYASASLWISLVAAACAWGFVFLQKYRSLLGAGALALAVVAAFFVLLAGAHGGELVQIYGLGVAGRPLP